MKSFGIGLEKNMDGMIYILLKILDASYNHLQIQSVIPSKYSDFGKKLSLDLFGILGVGTG